MVDASVEQVSEDQKKFIAFVDEHAKNVLRRQPLYATSLGVTEAYLGMKFSDQLGSFTLQDVEKEKSVNAEAIAFLETINRDELKGVARSTYDALYSSLTMASKFKPYVHGAFGELGVFSPFVISQLSGPHIDIPRSLQTEHPLKSEPDAQDYIARLSQVKGLFEGVAIVLAEDTKNGILPPAFAIEGALGFIKQVMAAPPAKNPLVTSFETRLKEIESLSQEEQKAFVDAATHAVKSSVYPGYGALEKALTDMLPKASTNAGIWDLKDGATRYQLALENFGAGGKTAEEIHQLGLAEVARIQKEMDVILTSQGYKDGEIMERYIALTKDEKFIYPNNDEGRTELLSDLNKQMDEISGLLPNILITLPKAGVEVRRIAEYEQDGAPGGYYTSPSLDGSRPGIYWINLKNTADWPKFTLPTLTYHEASPGHHLQVAISQQIENMPMIRNLMWYSAYGEGWALYAEVLAKELGLYDNDPLGDLGRLQSELFRAARLVVDTGLHHKQWSREEAIEYMHNTTGDTVAAVTREVERYSVWPGQACSYKLGQIKILELREFAKQTLGDNFDLRAFNDQILIHGSVPLPVLEANIKEWVAKSKV
ncbi:hypothetical protein GCM10007877_14690 [Marinibactrum halimedae]|uniref:DUF885 domain-containing protein n=2 Tax=Marinibactrum halimedae TaxID=1444977 RepID=A0AA37T304_9GAMM|nr:hypothetical protein GCM10007877_14690 [Marinibactrum halimedae]